AAPGTYALGSSNLDASTPDGDEIPTGAVGGSVTVLGSALRERADTAGTAPGRPCTLEQPCPSCNGPLYCPNGLCVGMEGVCEGGADDGLLADCPGGTRAAPIRSAVPAKAVRATVSAAIARSIAVAAQPVPARPSCARADPRRGYRVSTI